MFAVIVRLQELSYDLGLSSASGSAAFKRMRCAQFKSSRMPCLTGYFGQYGNGTFIFLMWHCERRWRAPPLSFCAITIIAVDALRRLSFPQSLSLHCPPPPPPIFHQSHNWQATATKEDSAAAQIQAPAPQCTHSRTEACSSRSPVRRFPRFSADTECTSSPSSKV